MSLQIDPTERGLRLAGELDMATSEELMEALRDRGQGAPVTLDFSGVTFMDSSGLRTLLEASKAREGDGVIVILDPTPQVRRVLDISLPDGAPGLEVRGGEEASS
ncbi:MAG TPA: STAS domain-containing protein [Actinomycetota bacterium]|nr:STAS domain-containing protein [Actinomycetota bacterium]